MVDIQEIPPEKINWHSTNIRSVIDETGALAESMQAHGQLEPGTGWWEGDTFRLATGHRRANACRHLGIPFLARIIRPMSGTDLIEYQLVENVQAEALRPEDLEEAVASLMEAYGDHRKVGERIGKSPTWVSTIIGAGTVRKSLGTEEPDGESRSSTGEPGSGAEKSVSRGPSMSTTAAAEFGRLKDEENRQAAYDEAVRRNSGSDSLSRGLVREVVDEYSENEIRDVQAYFWKLPQERVKLVRKRADIEAEIDRIDSKIANLTRK